MSEALDRLLGKQAVHLLQQHEQARMMQSADETRNEGYMKQSFKLLGLIEELTTRVQVLEGSKKHEMLIPERSDSNEKRHELMHPEISKLNKTITIEGCTKSQRMRRGALRKRPPSKKSK